MLALKRPAEVARATVALDLISGGRLVFGAGLGSSAAEFQALGHDPDPRVRAEKLDEALQVLDGLWAGRPFDVVMEGRTAGLRLDDDAQVVAPYRAAGLTWWVEKLGWFRGPVELVRARIESGPPLP